MAEDTRNAQLNLNVQTKGTDKAEKEIAGISKTVQDVDRELRSIGKSNMLADSFREADKELDKLTDDIRRDLKGSLDEAARSASDIKPGSSSGGGAPAAAKFRGAASLVGGGEIVGLIDDFQDLGEGLLELSDAAPGAIDGMFKLAAGMGPGGLLVAGAAAAAVGLASLALKGLADESQKAYDTVSSILDEQRSIREQVAGGATQEELKAQLEETIRLRELEADALKRNQQLYNDQFQPGGIVDTAATLFDGSEQALAEDLDKGTKLVSDYDIKIQELQRTIDSGIAPIGDTAAAEKELAQVRQTETPKAIDTATKAERDHARETERAQQQAQREQEQVQREAQQNAEKAAAAQQKYADGIKSANTTFKQASQDINTKLGQALADNLTGMFRDIEDLSMQFRRDTFDMDLKANQAERDAFTEHLRDIDDIREDAYKSEREALEDGNFKEAFLAKRAGAEALQREQLETRREGADRRQALADERADLLRSAQQQRTDRMTAYERANVDARTAQQRELQQAQVTRTRALEMNTNGYKAELAQQSQFLQARNQMLMQANQQVLAQLGGNRSGGSSAGMNATGQSVQQLMNSAVLAIFQR